MSTTFSIPISAIKVRIPPKRRELISRPRLIDQLYDQLDKSLLFVIAPAGYGKTSLLVDLASQVDLSFCWLSLDALDQDPQRFLRYLIAAIAERFPSFGKDSLSVLEAMTSLESDQEQVLITVTNEINAKIRDHFILVLDDYHFVEGAPVIGQVVSRFLQLAGENVHLVLSSRNLPDLPLVPLLIARDQAGGLSYRDLSFRREEIQTLFQKNKGIEITSQDAETLVHETEGWIAAIHLSNGTPGTLPQFNPLVSTAVLFDFFSREVMDRQPEAVRRFMLLTSMFDAFDSALCEQVLAPLLPDAKMDWTALFKQVRSSNLFSVSLDHEGQWMRYHHLFQHFLRSQLQYESPALAWSIQQNLARAYEEQQHWEEALQIYDRLNDYQNQIRVLNEAGVNFIGAGRIVTLDNWLKKIPIDLVFTQLALVSLLGAVHSTQGDQRQALTLLNRAEAGLREAGDQKNWVVTLVRRAEANRQLGSYADALNDIEKILETIGEMPSREFLPVFAEAHRIKGLALFGQGHVRDALPWLEDSLQQYRRLGLQFQIPILETELGVVHRRLGEVHITAQYYSSALQRLEHSGNTGWKARLLNNMGMLKYMTGYLDEAYHLLQEAIQVAKKCGYVRIHTNALISLGDLLTELGSLDAAYACYDEALTQATHLGHSLYIFYASLGEARLKRLSGDPIVSMRDLRQVELSQVHLGSYERAIFNLEQGLCLLDVKKLDEAVIAFHEACRLFGEGGNQTEQSIARLWYDVSFSSSAAQPVSPGLLDMLPTQREWRIPTPIMIHAGWAARWIKSHHQARIIKDPSLRLFFEHAARVLDGLPIWREKIFVDLGEIKPLTPRLDISTFGEVQVLHDGRQVELSDWQTREARDLFFYLLQSPPRTKEQIALDFWPDLSPARLKMRFKINMYRIRQALGQDAVIYKDENYSFNRSISYVWDRERFDELFLASQRKTAIQERIELLERAVGLMKGGYLSGLEAPWAEGERILYEERRREAMINLAGLYLRKGRGQECLSLARGLLAIDPLMEAGHRLVLEACAAEHDPAGLALQYRQYQQMLEDELGMLPSLEMRTLYEKLLTTI